MYFISDILHHVWFVCVCVCVCVSPWCKWHVSKKKKKKRSWLRLFYSSVEIVLWVFGSYINCLFDLFFFFFFSQKTPRWWQTLPFPTHSRIDTPHLKRHCSRRVSVTPRRHGAVYVNICLAQSVYSLSYLKKQIISGSAPLPSGTCSSFTEIILSVGRARGSVRIRKRVKKNKKICASCNIPFECF